MSRLIKKKRFSKKESEVVGCVGNKRKTTALIDTGDVHALMIGAAGVGKTAYWLYLSMHSSSEQDSRLKV